MKELTRWLTIVDSWMRGLSRSSGLLDEKTRWMSDSNGLPIVCQLKFLWHKKPKVCQFFFTSWMKELTGWLTIVGSWMRGLSHSSGLLDEKTIDGWVIAMAFQLSASYNFYGTKLPKVCQFFFNWMKELTGGLTIVGSWMRGLSRIWS